MKMPSGAARIVAVFTLAGGIGTPVFFIASWQIISRTLQGDRLINVMEWFESFRFMLWPSVMFLVHRQDGGTQQWVDLLVAVGLNVALYAALGCCVAFAIRHRLSQVPLLICLIAILYGLNVYWSQHLASFLVVAALVVALFAPILRTR